MSNCGEVITEMTEQILSLIGVILGGSWLTVLVANRKNTQDDKQEIINQLQEERQYFSEQLKERDVKIDELYGLVRGVEARNQELVQQKLRAEWELELSKSEVTNLLMRNQELTEESQELRIKVQELEKRVTELEKEE